MKHFSAFALLGLLLLANPAGAETVKDREGALRGDKARMEQDPRWNYNDLEGGFKMAKATGKPLLVVLRCVPCLSCAGIDAGVLEEKELAPVLDLFVCVRVINANALDLARFQFDYDLSFSAMMFNGDGTVYGRFGSWQHQQDPLDKTTAGFKKALEAALALHQAWPANRQELAGKQGVAMPYATPVEFPALAAKYGSKLDWEGKVVQSCVHCHMIGDAVRTHFRNQPAGLPLEWIYPQPSLAVVGAVLAPDDIARVTAVRPDTPAAEAGLQPGDHLVSLNGQPLVSPADVAWVLHRAPDSGTLPMVVRRPDGASALPMNLRLPAGWRRQSDISRRAGTWPMRAMAFGGMQMEDLDDAERTRLGLSLDSMALRIRHVGQYGPHAAAKKEGFKVQDILIQVDTLTSRITEGALIGHLLTQKRPGQKLPATVLRDSGRLSFQLPQQ